MSLICVVGGTNIKSDIRGFRANPDIVVATPGRLNDHLDNYNLAGAMQGLSHLIFDEADQVRMAMFFTLCCMFSWRYFGGREGGREGTRLRAWWRRGKGG